MKRYSCCDMRAALSAFLVKHPIVPKLVAGRVLAYWYWYWCWYWYCAPSHP